MFLGYRSNIIELPLDIKSTLVNILQVGTYMFVGTVLIFIELPLDTSVNISQCNVL